jgi:hypothetical protein
MIVLQSNTIVINNIYICLVQFSYLTYYPVIFSSNRDETCFLTVVFTRFYKDLHVYISELFCQLLYVPLTQIMMT